MIGCVIGISASIAIAAPAAVAVPLVCAFTVAGGFTPARLRAGYLVGKHKYEKQQQAAKIRPK